MDHFTKALTKVMDPIFQRRGFVRSKIILDWQLIVGERFAAFCIPERIDYPMEKKTGGRLVIKTTSSFAMQISFCEPVIIEKINRYFGYKAVERLSISHSYLPKPASPKGPDPVLSEEQKEALNELLEGFSDASLKEALYNLGKGIMLKDIPSPQEKQALQVGHLPVHKKPRV